MNTPLRQLFDNVNRVIIGKEDVTRLAVCALLARGHLLIEDAPGLGKTLLARALARSFDGSFKRVQFTPDLLPTDVTGLSIYHAKEESFEFMPGPVFTQFLLADEINRTSPRTQSSLLEAMEERQVTVEGRTHRLPEVFFVLATQNPVELTGTYPLPEAQIDRFLMRISLGYPDHDEEMRILDDHRGAPPITSLEPVLNTEQLMELQDRVLTVHVSEAVRSYIVSLCARTRSDTRIRLGVSPRGGIALMHAAQAWAFLSDSEFVTPDHVKAVAPYVLGHRVLLETHHEHTGTFGTDIVRALLDEVAVPTLGPGRHAAEL